MTPELLLQVKASFSLTGLGVLLLPEPATTALAALDLHTVWAVQLVFPDGSTEEATASVEEVTRPAAEAESDPAPVRALLLTHAGATPVPAGTRVFRLTGPGT